MSDKYEPFQRAWDLMDEARKVRSVEHAKDCLIHIKAEYFKATDNNIKSILLNAARLVRDAFPRIEASVSDFVINN